MLFLIVLAHEMYSITEISINCNVNDVIEKKRENNFAADIQDRFQHQRLVFHSHYSIGLLEPDAIPFYQIQLKPLERGKNT